MQRKQVLVSPHKAGFSILSKIQDLIFSPQKQAPASCKTKLCHLPLASSHSQCLLALASPHKVTAGFLPLGRPHGVSCSAGAALWWAVHPYSPATVWVAAGTGSAAWVTGENQLHTHSASVTSQQIHLSKAIPFVHASLRSNLRAHKALYTLLPVLNLHHDEATELPL